MGALRGKGCLSRSLSAPHFLVTFINDLAQGPDTVFAMTAAGAGIRDDHRRPRSISTAAPTPREAVTVELVVRVASRPRGKTCFECVRHLHILLCLSGRRNDHDG